MPRGYSADFRSRAVELVRSGVQPSTQVAKIFGIAQSTLRSWVAADIEREQRERTISMEHHEITDLRERMREISKLVLG
ncbi:MAG: transposase [Segniliparus sp.]|uniref:transposase n=1 Tax=Segniliparus sp. TaxID=2804064 RepID=UPI003F3E17BE